MGLSAEITIAAPPTVVRGIFLDFQHLSEWHSNFFFENIETADPKKTGLELHTNDGLKVKFNFMPMTMKAKVGDNSSQRFIWFGGMPVLGGGKHTFEFLPGPEPNTTVFRQSEEFSGMMKIFYSDPEGKRGQGTIQNWNKVNGELKRAAEKKYKTEQPTVGAA